MRSSSAKPPFDGQLTTGIPEAHLEASGASFSKGMHPIVSSVNQISPELEITANAEAPLVVALVGPTASGKTALAIELAEHFQLEILNIDSRQLYREMDIGTANPTAEQRPPRSCERAGLRVRLAAATGSPRWRRQPTSSCRIYRRWGSLMNPR